MIAECLSAFSPTPITDHVSFYKTMLHPRIVKESSQEQIYACLRTPRTNCTWWRDACDESALRVVLAPALHRRLGIMDANYNPNKQTPQVQQAPQMPSGMFPFPASTSTGGSQFMQAVMLGTQAFMSALATPINPGVGVVQSIGRRMFAFAPLPQDCCDRVHRYALGHANDDDIEEAISHATAITDHRICRMAAGYVSELYCEGRGTRT